MACTQYLGFSDLPNIYNTTFPVGPDMPNVRDDVLLVQTLMKLANFYCSYERGSVERSRCIDVDGWFGEQTRRMIEAFEIVVREKHLLLVADGVIEPSSDVGYTAQGLIYKIIHLNQFARQATRFGNEYDQIPTDPKTHPILRQSLLVKKGEQSWQSSNIICRVST
jgi:hypothetical protein